ncbi:MAG: efflux RND transporter periplasmic adaptor subunit [Gemmataceae bacterium]
MKRGSIRLVALLLLVLVVASGGGFWYYTQQTNESNQSDGKKGGFGPALIHVGKVVRKEVQPHQTFVGNVMPTRISKVGSAASGRVEEFLINEGDRVAGGQPIAQLRTKTIQSEYDAAEALLKVRKAELAELLQSWDEDKKRVRAQLAMRSAILAYEELRLSVVNASYVRGAESVDKLAEAKAFKERAQASVTESEAQMALLGTPRETRHDQAKAKVEAAQAEVNRLATQKSLYTLKSPFDGYVVREYTEAGEWVLQGALIAEIAELDYVDVQVAVLEDYTPFIRVGDKVRVEVPAVNKTFDGEVSLIVPRATRTTRTFPMKVRVKNEMLPVGNFEFFWVRNSKPLIKADMMARVELPVAERKSGLFVPRDALVLQGQDLTEVSREGQRSIIYLVEDGKAKLVPVTLGVSSGDFVEVIGNVTEGAVVVTQGNERLRPGQPVRTE